MGVVPFLSERRLTTLSVKRELFRGPWQDAGVFFLGEIYVVWCSSLRDYIRLGTLLEF